MSVPLDPLAAVLQVNGVQAEAVLAGNQVEGPGGVGAKFVGVAGPAGVVAGGHDPATARVRRRLSNPPTSSPCQHCIEMAMSSRRFRADSVFTSNWAYCSLANTSRFLNKRGVHNWVPLHGVNRLSEHLPLRHFQVNLASVL